MSVHWCAHLYPMSYHKHKMSNCYYRRKIKILNDLRFICLWHRKSDLLGRGLLHKSACKFMEGHFALIFIITDQIHLKLFFNASWTFSISVCHYLGLWDDQYSNCSIPVIWNLPCLVKSEWWLWRAIPIYKLEILSSGTCAMCHMWGRLTRDVASLCFGNPSPALY